MNFAGHLFSFAILTGSFMRERRLIMLDIIGIICALIVYGFELGMIVIIFGALYYLAGEVLKKGR